MLPSCKRPSRPTRSFPFAGFRELGYESAHYGEGRWNGVAILSKVGLEDVTRGFGDDDLEARVIGARCGGVQVYSCYVPNGRALDHDHYQYKLRWLSHWARPSRDASGTSTSSSVATSTSRPPISTSMTRALFVGATHVSEPEREALRTLESGGLVDLTRRLHPDETIYSWWDYRNGAFHRGWGLRIDLLFVDRALAELATESYVDRDARKGEKPSDHAPVVGVFAL